MKTVVAVIITSAFLVGCANISKSINRYCAATTEAEREVIRARVNEDIAPNSIRINCANE